jgi:hypothetical protein
MVSSNPMTDKMMATVFMMSSLRGAFLYQQAAGQIENNGEYNTKSSKEENLDVELLIQPDTD